MAEVINLNEIRKAKKEIIIEDLIEEIEELEINLNQLQSRIKHVSDIKELQKIIEEIENIFEKINEKNIMVYQLSYSDCNHMFWQDEKNKNDIRCLICGFSPLSMKHILSDEFIGKEILNTFCLLSSKEYGEYNIIAKKVEFIRTLKPEVTYEELMSCLDTGVLLLDLYKI